MPFSAAKLLIGVVGVWVFWAEIAEWAMLVPDLHFAVHCHSLLFKEIQEFAVHIWRLLVDLCTGPIEGVYALAYLKPNRNSMHHL